MSDLITKGAAAMAAKRRELIAQPLDRIWPDLMRAAIEASAEAIEARYGSMHPGVLCLRQALKVQP